MVILESFKSSRPFCGFIFLNTYENVNDFIFGVKWFDKIQLILSLCVFWFPVSLIPICTMLMRYLVVVWL